MAATPRALSSAVTSPMGERQTALRPSGWSAAGQLPAHAPLPDDTRRQSCSLPLLFLSETAAVTRMVGLRAAPRSCASVQGFALALHLFLCLPNLHLTMDSQSGSAALPR